MPEKSILDELQASFPKTAKTDWIRAASSELSGKNPQESLSWSAHSTNTFAPYYDQSDRQPLGYQNNFQLSPAQNSFSGHRAWTNMPRVAITTEKNANQAARHHLMNGADGILFETPTTPVDLQALLHDIEWPYCHISFFASQHLLAQNIPSYCLDKSYDSKQIEGALFWQTMPPLDTDIVKTFQTFEKFKPLGFIAATSSAVQQIAHCLLLGHTCFEKYLPQNISAETIAHAIAFSIPIETDFLIAIAKIKALRILWYQIAKAYQCETFQPHHLHIHVRSEIFAQEALQPHSNMLKSTTASMAAICGGCNALTVYEEDPHSELQQRMARNTSVLLREESHFNKVADPTAGSYAIDTIVNNIAQEAWQLFQSHLTNPTKS